MSNSHATLVHYDVDQSFFGLFLDPYRKYTSGYFTSPDQTLDEAILAMLDKLVDSSGVKGKPAPRVLDIGCGWGALLRRLNETVPGLHYVGVSPSREQNDYIHHAVDPNAQLLTCTFEEAQIDGKFDAVFLIGSFCHLADKPAQLERIRSLMNPNGVIIIEDTFFLSEELYQKHKAHPATRFVQNEVFGFAEIHALSTHIDQCRSAGLKVTTVFEHSDSYKRTIAEWMTRLEMLDASKYPLTKPYYQYMGVFQRGWNYTIGNFLLTIQALERGK